jgi:hypothetical protein
MAIIANEIVDNPAWATVRMTATSGKPVSIPLTGLRMIWDGLFAFRILLPYFLPVQDR